MTAPTPDAATGPAPRAPGTLRWAVLLLCVEAAAFVVLTAYLLVMDVIGGSTNLRAAIALTVFTGLWAFGIALVGRALARRSAGARGPAIVVQIMLVVLAWYLIQAGLWWVGGPLLAVGLAIGVLVLLPSTTQALGLHRT